METSNPIFGTNHNLGIPFEVVLQVQPRHESEGQKYLYYTKQFAGFEQMGETLGDIVKDCDQTLHKFDAIFIKKVPGIDVKQLITVKKISDSEEEMKKIIDYDE